MARIYNSEREYILEELMKPIKKDLSENLKKLGTFVDTYCRNQIPREVLDVIEKYPKIVNKSYLSVNHLTGGRNSDFTTVPTIFYVEQFNTITGIKEVPEIKKCIEERLFLRRRERELEGRLNCILSSITTEKRLQEEFPEAYKLLSDRYDKSPQPKGCDSVEQIRAELFGRETVKKSSNK